MAELLEQNQPQSSAKIAIALPSERQQSLQLGDWQQAVLAMLGQAAEVLGAEVTPSQYDAYLRLLEGVPASEVAMALDRCLRESTFFPRPAEILRAAGRSPEAMADRALAEALAWAREWGPAGRRGGEVGHERVVALDGTVRFRLVERGAESAPALPWRTQQALTVVAGDKRRGLERLLDCADEPERYARFRREFVAAWKEAV